MFLIAPKCDNYLFLFDPISGVAIHTLSGTVRFPAPLGVFPSLPYYHIPLLSFRYVKYLKELEKSPPVRLPSDAKGNLSNF
jgi:hypothetical protein